MIASLLISAFKASSIDDDMQASGANGQAWTVPKYPMLKGTNQPVELRAKEKEGVSISRTGYLFLTGPLLWLRWGSSIRILEIGGISAQILRQSTLGWISCLKVQREQTFLLSPTWLFTFRRNPPWSQDARFYLDGFFS